MDLEESNLNGIWNGSGFRVWDFGFWEDVKGGLKGFWSWACERFGKDHEFGVLEFGTMLDIGFVHKLRV